MNKKWAILITVVIMAAVYLFLFVGIPALAAMVPSCGDDPFGGDPIPCETDNSSAILDIPANWTTRPSRLQIRPYREIFRAPWIIYSVPGLVGIAVIVLILTQKKEVK